LTLDINGALERLPGSRTIAVAKSPAKPALLARNGVRGDHDASSIAQLRTSPSQGRLAQFAVVALHLNPGF
jgi:hypothetical protein